MPDDILGFPCPSITAACDARKTAPLSLIDLPIGAHARVQGIRPAGDPDGHDLALRLLEIGFVAGEPVRVVAHGYPGREPVAVRVGGTTFALRRFEAERVLVETVR